MQNTHSRAPEIALKQYIIPVETNAIVKSKKLNRKKRAVQCIERLPNLVRDCRNTMTRRTSTRKLHHTVHRQLRENLATLFNLLFVLSRYRHHLIRDLVVIIDMQNVGLLLKHSRRGEAATVDAMVIVRIRRLKFLELFRVLRLDALPLLVIGVTS